MNWNDDLSGRTTLEYDSFMYIFLSMVMQVVRLCGAGKVLTGNCLTKGCPDTDESFQDIKLFAHYLEPAKFVVIDDVA